MNFHKYFSATAFALLLIAPAFADSLSTEEVVNKHQQAFGALDVEALLSDYTDESVLITPQGVVSGLDQLRPVFEAFVAEFSKPGMSLEIDMTHFQGDLGYVVWHGETADNVYEFATDTFIVEDGKIIRQTFAAKVSPK